MHELTLVLRGLVGMLGNSCNPSKDLNMLLRDEIPCTAKRLAEEQGDITGGHC